jgi:RNA polymerase sigma factor (sigma-70 family)
MHTRELQQQFESRVNEHRKIIYKVCNAYCPDREDREDLAQEILVQLWRSFGSFDGRCLFSTWMYRVALNTALSFIRREFRRRRYVMTVEDRWLVSVPAEEPETDQLRTLYELIAAFDPLNKALLLLYLDGNSSQEISDVLGISATNVATKINRLKENMKQQVADTVRPGKRNTI